MSHPLKVLYSQELQTPIQQILYWITLFSIVILLKNSPQQELAGKRGLQKCMPLLPQKIFPASSLRLNLLKLLPH